MLRKLYISNAALIDYLEIEFGSGLNIFTGETGAGKSIIIDSFFLLLGAKYDKSVLSHNKNSGYVLGEFDMTDSAREILNELGIDTDGEDVVILRRAFFADGRNEIRINGKSATLNMLRQIAAVLADVYGQNQHITLGRVDEQMKILDFFVKRNDSAVFKRVFELYSQLKDIKARLSTLGSESERSRRIDVLRFQIEEITGARLVCGEEDELLEKRKLVLSAEKIKNACLEASDILSGGDESVVSRVGVARARLLRLDSVGGFDVLAERLHSAQVEIDDIASTVAQKLDEVDFDDDEIEIIEKRLSVIRTIKRKYGDVEAAQEFVKRATAELEELTNADELCERLFGQRETVLDSLFTQCQLLRKQRLLAAKALSESIQSELSTLGMKAAQFEVCFNDQPIRSDLESAVGANGFDKIEFYFSANSGQPKKPLSKVISGGEMSRFMLALKVITARLEGIPTLVFDEIDTGISGTTGQAVGLKLAKIARKNQVLCVSHLSQIAAFASRHFYITKTASGNTTQTNITQLDENGIIEEITRLTGGKDISSAARGAAEQMRKWAVSEMEKFDD